MPVSTMLLAIFLDAYPVLLENGQGCVGLLSNKDSDWLCIFLNWLLWWHLPQQYRGLQCAIDGEVLNTFCDLLCLLQQSIMLCLNAKVACLLKKFGDLCPRS